MNPQEPKCSEMNSDYSDLKRKSVRGGIVTIGSQGITVAVQLVSTVILARILTPEDYGTLAMVTAITAFAALFRDLGLSSAAIQKKGLTTAQQSNLFWLNVLAGTVLTAVIAACAPLVARFYGKPELLNVTLVLSLSFIITSLGTQHGAMLVRRMQFGRSSGARISGALATLGVSVVCGLRGYAYWSLVWGTLAGAIVTTLMLFVLSPFSPGLPNRGSGVRELVGFGANVTAFNFVNYFSRNLDNILIGKFVGADALGVYGRAYQLLMFPIINLRAPIQAVAFPAMSQLQDDPEELRDYYLQTTELLAFLTMPIICWMAVVSDSLIYYTLGSNWMEAAGLFRWLAVAAFIQPVTSLSGSLLMSIGDSRRYLIIGCTVSLAVCVAFFVGIFWGVTGIVISYALINWIVLYPWLTSSFNGTLITFFSIVKTCALPAGAALISLIVSLLFDWLLFDEAKRAFELIGRSSIFWITFISIFCSFSNGRKTIASAFELLKGLIKR